jgi:hypothetical protein
MGAREYSFNSPPSLARLLIVAPGRRIGCRRAKVDLVRAEGLLPPHSRPAPLGQPFDNRRQDQPIAGMPPRSAHLPLQHPQLMPQGQHFSLELHLLPIANAQQVDQRPGD